jgi:CRP-like cAMP-binding protein
MRAEDFREVLPNLPELSRRVLLYSQLAFDVTSQSAACNRVHVTEERCARWLLMSQDRAGRGEFKLTQVFLAQMLGVRRPAVTVAIGVLENAGLIQHRRGRIRITNRAGLEDAACECYSRVRARQKELLGF